VINILRFIPFLKEAHAIFISLDVSSLLFKQK